MDPRVLRWRVTLFFLAAGVWLAGLIVDDPRVTGAALMILALALLLRFVGPRAGADEDEDESEDERERRGGRDEWRDVDPGA